MDTFIHIFFLPAKVCQILIRSGELVLSISKIFVIDLFIRLLNWTINCMENSFQISHSVYIMFSLSIFTSITSCSILCSSKIQYLDECSYQGVIFNIYFTTVHLSVETHIQGKDGRIQLCSRQYLRSCFREKCSV